MPNLRHLILLCVITALLQACIFVPVTTEIFDEGCQIVAKQLEMHPVQIGTIAHCSNENCAALLVAAGATAAASAVISGSIVVVGNVVYWFEKQGRCQRSG